MKQSLSLVTFLLIGLLFSFPAWATFYNAGIYINATNAEFGQTIVLNGAIKSDVTKKGVFVRIGLHKISDQNVIDSNAIFTKDYSGQNFTANSNVNFSVPYTVPASVVTGKYAMVMKVGSTVGGNDLLLAQGLANAWVVNLKGQPAPVIDASFVNTGVYIPVTTVKAGSSITINNALKATATITATVKLELKKVSDSGAISSSALVTKVLASQSFTANQSKNFTTIFAIPADAAAGKYILAVTVTNSAGKQVFNYSQVSSINSFTVQAIVVTPPVVTPPVVTPPVVIPPVETNVTLTNTGIYIPTTSVAPGAAITIHNSVASNKDINGLTVKMDVKNTSTGAVIASYSQAGQNFLANQSKNYTSAYGIPQSAAAGSYAVVVTVTNTSGAVLLSYNDVTSSNSLTVTGAVVVPPPVASGSYVRGINIMDMGIGDVFPGVYNTNYTRPTLQSLQALKDRGMQVVRLPFKWERAQTTLNGPLNPVYMSHIFQMLKDCKKVGLVAILDMHNYGRYHYSNGTEGVFGAANGPTKAQYADAWIKIANEVRANSDAYEALYAYDIMNEPYSLPTNTGITDSQVWETYAQAAVTAIRSTGDNKMIHVEGYQFAAPHRWANLHPKPFITDPANNIMYHAHLYMDNDTSGSYKKSYDDEEKLAISQGYSSVGARTISNLKIFANWCTKFKQKCFLGEFGWPNSNFGGIANAQKWNQAGEEMMNYMDSIGMGGTMWSTGSWLSPTGNILNAYVLPTSNNNGPIIPLSQSSVLEKHMGN